MTTAAQLEPAAHRRLSADLFNHTWTLLEKADRSPEEAKIPYFFMAEAYSKMADNGRIINMVTTQVAVTAGPQKTPFFYDAETPETVAWLSGVTISGDVGDPADVVPVMRFLAAPESRWVTAQTIYVNGGMIAPIS